MELSIFTKTKIAIAIAVGVVFIGLFAWPMLHPATPFDSVVFLNSNITFAELCLTAILAVIAGFISGFLTRPYTTQIAIIAAPAGLAAVALRSGDMSSLLKANATPQLQHAVYSSIRWEGISWLIVFAAGILGVIIANIVFPSKPENLIEKQVLQKSNSEKKTTYLNIAASLVASVVIAHVLISILARDVIISQSSSATVVAQPAKLQVAFAVFVSFMAAGYVTKLVLKTSYLWPCVATAVVCFLELTITGRLAVIESLSQNWPIGFFYNSSASILPIQYIAFGTLGSIAGYWLAIRYAWWKKYCA